MRYNYFQQDDGLKAAIDKFFMGVHIVPILSADGELVNVLTQTDVIEFFARNNHLLRYVYVKPLGVSYNC